MVRDIGKKTVSIDKFDYVFYNMSLCFFPLFYFSVLGKQ